MVRLKWTELHRNQNLGLLFDSIDEYRDRHDTLTALCNAASRFAILQRKLAVICRDEAFEISTWT